MFEKVTIVVSATDESESLIKTVDTIVDSCATGDIYEFLVVIPSNAAAECLEAIDFLKNKYPGKVRELIQRRPGIGGGMRDAIDEINTSHIMFLSADIPIGLDVVPVMIEKSKRQPEKIVKISRWSENGSFYGYGKARKVFNYLAQIFLKILYSFEYTEFTCPVLISPTHIYKKINFRELGFPCLLEAVLIPIRLGHKIEEIPAKCFPRTEGKSKNSAAKTAMYLFTALRVRFAPKRKLIKSKDK